MKHLLLLSLALVLLTLYPIYGYEVPTTVQKKNILLEEFTGIHCGNCPDGHAIANTLATFHPENAYVIAIHSGYYAEPSNGEPDFRTEIGEQLDVAMGANKAGYPCGMINRTFFSDISTSILISRSQWIKKAKIIHEEDAPVNLWISSSYDGNSKELKIKVEGYYTSEVEDAEQYLNVAWIQNNILGPQNGSQTASGTYVHKHMLRGYVTPIWGDEISPAPAKGSYFTKEYTYTVPADINSVEVKPEDIEVLAFVTTKDKVVLNVTGGKPVYNNYSKPIGGKLYEPDMVINGRYGYNFFEVKLTNTSDQPITSADFKVTINEEEQDASWTGNIASFATTAIKIPVSSYTIKGSNKYKIQLTAINGTAFNGNVLEGDFSKPIESTPIIFIELKTDKSSEENTYTIKDQDGKIIKQFGPYESGKSEVYQESAQLEPNKNYCFEITDSWGDGIQNPPGYFKLYKDNHDLIAQNYSITLAGTRAFFYTSLPSAITNKEIVSDAIITVNPDNKNIELNFKPSSTGKAIFTVYSLIGEKLFCEHNFVTSGETYKQIYPFGELKTGVYLFNIEQGNYMKTLKFIIN